MDAFTDLVSAVTKAGWPGIAFGLLVLLTVYFAKGTGLVISGNAARIANLTLSALLAGLGSNGAGSNETLVAGIAALTSSLIHEILERVTQRNLVSPKAE